MAWPLVDEFLRFSLLNLSILVFISTLTLVYNYLLTLVLMGGGGGGTVSTNVFSKPKLGIFRVSKGMVQALMTPM